MKRRKCPSFQLTIIHQAHVHKHTCMYVPPVSSSNNGSFNTRMCESDHLCSEVQRKLRFSLCLISHIQHSLRETYCVCALKKGAKIVIHTCVALSQTEILLLRKGLQCLYDFNSCSLCYTRDMHVKGGTTSLMNSTMIFTCTICTRSTMYNVCVNLVDGQPC